MSAANQNTTSGSIELSTDPDTAELVDALESVAESNRQLAERVAQLEQENREQAARIESLEAELEETREGLDTVEDELDDAQEHRSRMARDHAKTRGRVSDLEEDFAGGDANSRLQEVEGIVRTPLERAVACSEELAADELTKNQQRARWIAKDIEDYASPTRGGYVISSTDIKTVLAALDESTHDETVNRVIDFFEELGKAEVSVAKRRGTRRVRFSEELVTRLDEVNDAAITSCVMADRMEA